MLAIPKVCEPKRLYHRHDDLPVHPNDNEFHVEYKWEGIVISIDGEEVTSELHHVESGDDYEFIFNKKQAEDDIELIEEGALFELYTGHLINNTEEKIERIRFKRIQPDKVDIDAILKRMKEIDFGSIIERH